MKQMVNVEIIMEFNDHPIVDIQFRYVHFTIYHHCMAGCSKLGWFEKYRKWCVFLFSVNGMSQRIALPLPLFASKFFTPTEMNSQDFFSRWKQLGR